MVTGGPLARDSGKEHDSTAAVAAAAVVVAADTQAASRALAAAVVSALDTAAAEAEVEVGHHNTHSSQCYSSALQESRREPVLAVGAAGIRARVVEPQEGAVADRVVKVGYKWGAQRAEGEHRPAGRQAVELVGIRWQGAEVVG